MFGKLLFGLKEYGKKSKVDQQILNSVDSTTMSLLQKNNKALNLQENVIADAKNLTNQMASGTMLGKMAGNPILGQNAQSVSKANPLNLFKKFF